MKQQRKRPPPREPLRLNRASEATIDPRKLRDYALKADHEPDGKHKAYKFRRELALERDDWEYLSAQILERLPSCEVTGLRPRPPFGHEYEVVIPIDGRNGERHPVVTGWMDDGKQPPRLTSAYVLTP